MGACAKAPAANDDDLDIGAAVNQHESNPTNGHANNGHANNGHANNGQHGHGDQGFNNGQYGHGDQGFNNGDANQGYAQQVTEPQRHSTEAPRGVTIDDQYNGQATAEAAMQATVPKAHGMIAMGYGAVAAAGNNNGWAVGGKDADGATISHIGTATDGRQGAQLGCFRIDESTGKHIPIVATPPSGPVAAHPSAAPLEI